MNNQFYKNMALWVVILLMVLMLVTMLRQAQPDLDHTSYSEFISRLDAGQVESVVINGNHITGRLKEAGEFSTYVPAITDGLLTQLREQKVEVVARPQRDSPIWQTVLVDWFPFLLFLGLWIFFLRQMLRSR